MCFGERVGDLRCEGERLFQLQRFALDSRVERLALNVLHGDEAAAILFADFMNRANIWMI